MEITNNQNKAVNDIVEMVVAVIGNGSREIDTTEAISSTARLAGSFLFRSFGFEINDAKPGTVMLSEVANTKGPQLVNITQAVLQNFGIQIDNSKMSSGNQKQAESNFVDIINKVQNPALEIMKKNDLSYEQMAQSGAIATAFIIQQSGNITPEEGFGTAIYHYIEGTKTYPPEFSSASKKTTNTKIAEKANIPSNGSKPWWKFW
ncbi:hypothetical protein HZY62_07275 [Maribacter polysiphoniae]|uniref:Uncharacterized protein n=1 Tax=Maribacter polysiphoniae TaxID=429344 RepID=A0A316E584_9FLAO|nr:hypothetical protein [Maribacter polysiphoniae]MBD1260383.1 hypothetical protein [Maribacter polysiphoniae]PWK25847.1 hypothetical protein LX92_00591 [Maribacter polysiphoniae]